MRTLPAPPSAALVLGPPLRACVLRGLGGPPATGPRPVSRSSSRLPALPALATRQAGAAPRSVRRPGS
eukprot:4273213-Alexandrium_andersonii.AAC.1